MLINIAIGVGIYAVSALIISAILGAAHEGDKSVPGSRILYWGFTWPVQFAKLLAKESFRGRGTSRGTDRDWVGGGTGLVHRKHPIEIMASESGNWRYRVGRHSGNWTKSENHYSRLELCKEDAIDAYHNWELEQSKKVAS